MYRAAGLKSPVPATLLAFAHANDAVAATPKKLEKQAILSSYFAGLTSPEDLRRAVRFAGGEAFGSTDPRTTGVSGAIMLEAVSAVWSPDRPALRASMIRHGEIAQAVAELVPSSHSVPETGLTLSDLADAFDRLAATGSQQGKREIIADLLRRIAHPREAAYLVRIVLGDMRTGAKEGILQAAIARAFDATLEQVQRALFMIGDLDEVAALAFAKRLHEARFRLFHPLQFMLATPHETARALQSAFGGRTFLAEDKLDGIRAQIHREGDRVAIYSRTMDRIDESFPEIVEAARRAQGSFLADGEIVAVDPAGAIRSFAHLQPRLGRKAPSPSILRRSPVRFAAFDLLYRDGELLLDQPLIERRRRLEQLGGDFLRPQPVQVSTAAEIEAAFSAARDRRNEGLVLKDPQSPYSPGRRGQSWFKLKTHLPTLDCVVTAAEYGHGKRRGKLSDYTFAVWDRDPEHPEASLVNVGKAYSGVTDEEIEKLTELFKSISISDNGRVFRVPPQVVLEIAMDQVQRSTRHASGFSLRFPRIKRIRWDKRPEDADRIDRVRDLFASEANVTNKDHRPPEPELFDPL